MLLLIGVLFFFLGLETIQRVLKDRVEYELDEINKKCQEQILRLTRIASDEDHNDKNNEMNYTSNLLDAFQKQREQCEGINTNLYDISSIGRFIGALLLPFITDAIKSNPALILHLFDNSHVITNYLLPK